MKAEGRVFKYGDNVDTDVIIPARYLNSSDPAELAFLLHFISFHLNHIFIEKFNHYNTLVVSGLIYYIITIFLICI